MAPAVEAPYARSRLASGDILMTIRGSYGAVAQVPPEIDGANITQDTARIASRQGVDRRFLFHALRSADTRRQVELVATGAGVKGVNIWSLKRIMLPVPPLQAQREIAARLDREDRRARDLVDEMVGLRRTLQEYREALITEAVTGKLDVAKLGDAQMIESLAAVRQGAPPELFA